MDYNYTLRIDVDELNRFQNISKSEHIDIRIQAMSYMMYKIGKSDICNVHDNDLFSTQHPAGRSLVSA